jgi:hypothetical protein
MAKLSAGWKNAVPGFGVTAVVPAAIRSQSSVPVKAEDAVLGVENHLPSGGRDFRRRLGDAEAEVGARAVFDVLRRAPCDMWRGKVRGHAAASGYRRLQMDADLEPFRGGFTDPACLGPVPHDAPANPHPFDRHIHPFAEGGDLRHQTSRQPGLEQRHEKALCRWQGGAFR